MSKHYLFLVTLALALALSAAAQDGPDYAGCGHASNFFTCNGECNLPPSEDDPEKLHLWAGDLLQTKYAVKLTEDDLRIALANDDEQVRYLAAWVLADQGQKGVIPDIYLTFKAETLPRPKSYLACALAELGDRRGVAALHDFCGRYSFPADLRLDVVRFLVELHETPCIGPIVEALKGGFPGNMYAQSIIPHLEGLSSSESAQLRGLLLGLLSNQGSAVRMVAAQTLSQLHVTSAIPALQAALANETNHIARDSMEDSLKNLQGDQH